MHKSHALLLVCGDPNKKCEDELRLQVVDSYSLCTGPHQHATDDNSLKEFQEEELIVGVENQAEEDRQETSGGGPSKQSSDGLHVAKASLEGRNADLSRNGALKTDDAHETAEDDGSNNEIDDELFGEVENQAGGNSTVEEQKKTSGGSSKKHGKDGLNVVKTGRPEGQQVDLDRDSTLQKEGSHQIAEDDGSNEEIDEDFSVNFENYAEEHQETSASLITKYDFERRWSGGGKDRSGRSKGGTLKKESDHQVAGAYYLVECRIQTADDDGPTEENDEELFVDVENYEDEEESCSAEHQETSGSDPKEEGADGQHAAKTSQAGRMANLSLNGTMQKEGNQGNYQAAMAYNLVEYYHGRREVEVLIHKAAPLNVSLRSFTSELPWTNVSLEFGPSTSGSLRQVEDDPPKPQSKEKILKAPRMRMLFKCNACSKTFSHQGNLELHTRTH